MVQVKRITANLACPNPIKLASFYRQLFDLDIAMDLDWITTLQSEGEAPVQLSVASEGGSSTPVPHLSFEVDDLDAVFARAEDLEAKIVYPLTEEPWGVRRFFVADPDGRVLNVMEHK